MANEETKKEKKDVWDIVNVISSALIPAAIALAGFFYSNAIKSAEDRANDLKNQKDQEIAAINSQIGQAQLLSTFMKSLLSTDSLEQTIAINAVLIGVPVQGKQIVDLIARSKNKGAIQQVASSALTSRRAELITSLYSVDKIGRIGAAAELSNSWIKDKKTVQDLISSINSAYDNSSLYSNPGDGVYNCFVILQNADPAILQGLKEELTGVVAKIPADNTKTKEAGQRVLGKIK